MQNRQNILQIASSQINAINNAENATPTDIASDSTITVHDKLYDEAIKKLKAEYKTLFSTSNNYVITELGSGTINEAPFVSVSIYNKYTSESNNTKPKRYLFSLEKWWPNNFYGSETQKTGTNTSNIKEGKYKTWADWTNTECTYIDYIKGKAEIKSKIYGWKRIISLDLLLSLNKKETMIPMSESMKRVQSSDMFSYQYQNNSFV